MLAINPKIKQKAEDIRKKIFGSEVRESLASGIEAISEDVEATIGRQDYVEEQFQDVLDETTGKDVISAPELIAARNGKSNLKTRLDDEHAQVTAQLQQNTEKLDMIIDLKNPPLPLIGAKFDGITDDSLAIQAIIDHYTIADDTEDIPTGHTVQLVAPAGKSVINTTVTIPNYMRLVGAGRHATLFTSTIDDGSAIFKLQAISSKVGAYNALEGFTIHGQVKNNIGVEMVHCVRWTIRDINIMFCMKHGILFNEAFLGELYSVFVKYCGNTTDAGILLTGPSANYGSHAVKMYGGEVASCRGNGIEMRYGSSCGLYGSTVEGNGGAGILTNGGLSFNVIGVYFELNKHHIKHLGGTASYLNNFFGGQWVQTDAHIMVNSIYNSTITGNKNVNNNNFIGVTLEKYPTLFFENNTIMSNGENLISKFDPAIFNHASKGNIIQVRDGLGQGTRIYGDMAIENKLEVVLNNKKIPVVAADKGFNPTALYTDFNQIVTNAVYMITMPSSFINSPSTKVGLLTVVNYTTMVKQTYTTDTITYNRLSQDGGVNWGAWY